MILQLFENKIQRLVIFVSLLTIVIIAAGADAVNAVHDDCITKACRNALTAAKKATAKYHNVQKALEDGFVQVSECVSDPSAGTMGFHYANFERVLDPVVRPDEPEVLLYLPDQNGHLRLVAVEYVVPIGMVPEPPVLFGQEFHTDGPPLDQYSLHVWAWRNNPSGIFAPFNPKLSCPAV